MWFFSNARLCGLLDWSVYDCSGVLVWHGVFRWFA